MKIITEVTKQCILELFKRGISKNNIDSNNKITYDYYGILSEIDFLNRLYDLKKVPSLDPNYRNAEIDISYSPLVLRNYPKCWVFSDERFPLKDGNDEAYLTFLCEIFNPLVIDKERPWKLILDKVNEFLRIDKYELYSFKKISNQDVYNWRLYSPIIKYEPFSIRNSYTKGTNRFSIKLPVRSQIYKKLLKYDDTFYNISDTGISSYVSVSTLFFDEMNDFYIPKNYDEKGNYVETCNLEQFMLYNSPLKFLDAVEFFYRKSIKVDFEKDITPIFISNNINYRLENGLIVNIGDLILTEIELATIKEASLKELIQEAQRYYEAGDKLIAVEQIWDAYERLKSYYYPKLNKKGSIEKIIGDISNDKIENINLFNKEFEQITNIGNKYRIRHHEKNVTDIIDDNYYDYFYKKCFALISFASKYLEEIKTI